MVKQVIKNVEILSYDQRLNANAWYIAHKEHVTALMGLTDEAFPPTEMYDKMRPNCWKAEHWNWFFRKQL